MGWKCSLRCVQNFGRETAWKTDMRGKH